MNPTIERWKAELAALAPEERAELAEFLLESPKPVDPENEAAWDAEAARRVEEIRAGRVVGRPVEGLLDELRRLYPPDARIAKGIEFLRTFRQRKRMYVQPVDVPNVESFLTGFRIGCMAAGLFGDHGPWNRASERRGWACGAMSPADVMRERGLDDEAIMDELIEIEMLALCLLAGDDARADG